MSASLGDAGKVLRGMYARIEQQFIEDMVGTFDPDPYKRKAKYEQVPISKKLRRKLEAAEDLLYKHGARIEEGFNETREKRTWLETKEEYQNRLATLPEHRVDWIRQQLAEGKKPGRSAIFWDEDYREAIGVKDVQAHYGTVTFPMHRDDHYSTD